MREIKFRVFYNGDTYYSDQLGINQFWDVFKSEMEKGEISQYTGLKDKNGVEIYEGDILKESDHGVFEVIWQKEWAKFKLDWERVCTTIQYPEWNRGVEMEIIGNIYQNPELLK
jgi:uncharacterized phage protein (TIGR01671 family)